LLKPPLRRVAAKLRRQSRLPVEKEARSTLFHIRPPLEPLPVEKKRD
jgi:hypothetical protein